MPIPRDICAVQKTNYAILCTINIVSRKHQVRVIFCCSIVFFAVFYLTMYVYSLVLVILNATFQTIVLFRAGQCLLKVEVGVLVESNRPLNGRLTILVN